MKKYILVIITLIFFSNCTNNAQNNDILPHVQVNETVNLSLPEGQDLNVPGGWTTIQGGLSGIIVYRINQDQFKAFERAAPHIPMSGCSQLVVENNIRMRCPCDDSEFNILNGAPLTDGVSYSAREYLVTNLNGSVLRITNF